MRLESAAYRWLRYPNYNLTSNNILYVNSKGDGNNNNCSNSNGIRPALMEKRDE